jgi:hypothetical protein
MGVADREDRRRVGEFRTNRLDLFGPAKKRRAQEHECALLHAPMLAIEIRFDHVAVLAKPLLKCPVVGLERHRRLLVREPPAASPRLFA